jgi:hypothetical protein
MSAGMAKTLIFEKLRSPLTTLFSRMDSFRTEISFHGLVIFSLEQCFFSQPTGCVVCLVRIELVFVWRDKNTNQSEMTL